MNELPPLERAPHILSSGLTGVDRVLAEDELISHAQEAGKELVHSLAQAEAETLGWSNQAKTSILVSEAVSACLDRLTKTGCWGPANRLPSSELWRVTHEWLETGSLLAQARLKPRGYAGDFDLLAKICDDWRCTHPLGRALDEFFQNQAAPRAVRNRTRIVADAIVHNCREAVGEECHVVIVGSGPAREVELALSELSSEECRCLRVTLLDLDPAALEYAAARLNNLLPRERIRCVRENLFRLAKSTRADEIMQGATFLSCSGFFDYLGEDDAASLLALFWRQLAPGGTLWVFNFTPANSSRALMEWIGNWYLVYRRPEDLADLARLAGLASGGWRVGREELGVAAFLTASKAKSPASRDLHC